ncbi:hypothetical protein HanXRQr2_Chr16g0737171 [Helianthus annuus]|uniref:Uncharacterized protein n=1 Tax=Helianthus annuus TaxID=4232 RepID=A0A251U647_HELAN|nr:hypothetical protein HanXRQr2_Chr16g0737171 [Helianthus annuus]
MMWTSSLARELIFGRQSLFLHSPSHVRFFARPSLSSTFPLYLILRITNLDL